MAIRRPAALKKKGPAVKKAQTAKPKPKPKPKGDSLATTPTQVGSKSPDYMHQAGDPGFLKQYSEEQIGSMGGRSRINEIVAAKRAHNAYLVSIGQEPNVNMGGYRSPGSPGAPKTKKTAASGMAAPWENYGVLPASSVLKLEKEEGGAGGGGGGKNNKKGKKGKGGKGKKQTTRRRNEGRSKAGPAKPRGKK